ncbi:MAG: STAS domain-containing protein [Acidimicrobiales bacterium]
MRLAFPLAVGRRMSCEPLLSVQLRIADDGCILTLRGDVCASSLPALEAIVEQLGRLPCGAIVVDASEVGRLEPVGARFLAGLRHYVSGRGGHMAIRGASPEFALRLSQADLGSCDHHWEAGPAAS